MGNVVNWRNNLLMVVLILVFLHCGGKTEPPPRNQRDTTATTVAEQRSYGEMVKNPYSDLGLNRMEYKGKQLFDHFCAVCHGNNGDGNGFNAFNLENSFGVKPFNFTDSTAVANLTEGEMFQAIQNGGAAVGKSQYMPPWGYTLSSGAIQDLISYIRTFTRPGNEEK